MKKILRKLVALLVLTIITKCVYATIVFGTITDTKQRPIKAMVTIEESSITAQCDSLGRYRLEHVRTPAKLIISKKGFNTHIQSLVEASDSTPLEINQVLIPQSLALDEIVIASKKTSTTPQPLTASVVSTIDSKIFNATKALNLVESLNYTPGLRTESICQNCGATQVRMNGLDASYTQVLINSRPLFSSLVGVYGLEMIPTNMIERIEVSRGGGSALYGGNAIAGTINVITQTPKKNNFEAGLNYALLKGQTPDKTLHINTSVVDKAVTKGFSLYAYNRERNAWDANGDNFSDIPKQRNTVLGGSGFINIDMYNALQLNFFHVNQFRRGGDQLNLPPHQAQIAEQITHNLNSFSLNYDHTSLDMRQKTSVYSSIQHVDRDSYYGTGGRQLTAGDVITPADNLALNAYGTSKDLSVIAGLKHIYNINTQYTLTIGAEEQYNKVNDNMPGYSRNIKQQVNIIGSYSQLELKPTEQLQLLLGVRYDHIAIQGRYNFANTFSSSKNLDVVVPRAAITYNLDDCTKLKAAYAQGYRAPQAFNEDLHVETTGGAARFVILDNNLRVEQSNSFTASVQHDGLLFNLLDYDVTVEGFYTQLKNQFITADQQTIASGVTAVTKRNGSGAYVFGGNFDASLQFTQKLSAQVGFTLQQARYNKQETIFTSVTNSQDSLVTTKNLLRTPNVYGFFNITYAVTKPLALSISGIYTGAMKIPHIIDPLSSYTVIQTSKQFLELNCKTSYKLAFKDSSYLELFSGIFNFLNSFQSDLDKGPNRDSGYVYGPGRPITFYAGINFGFN